MGELQQVSSLSMLMCWNNEQEQSLVDGENVGLGIGMSLLCNVLQARSPFNLSCHCHVARAFFYLLNFIVSTYSDPQGMAWPTQSSSLIWGEPESTQPLGPVQARGRGRESKCYDLALQVPVYDDASSPYSQHNKYLFGETSRYDIILCIMKLNNNIETRICHLK